MEVEARADVERWRKDLLESAQGFSLRYALRTAPTPPIEELVQQRYFSFRFAFSSLEYARQFARENNARLEVK